ncbi:MAG: radical SAM protein [Planctomycetota bacterium]
MPGHPADQPRDRFLPRLIAWEVTRSCVLSCRHCRGAAQKECYEGELSTDECFRLLENLASFARPIIILTGGEPMLRDDIYDIARRGTELGLRMVMAPCGMLLDEEAARRMVDAGIQRISLSVDGATAESHDAFRGVPGAFQSVMRAVEAAKSVGLDFQINTTVSRHNVDELEDILQLATDVGASVFNPFLLVPTGRARDMADQEITPERYEETLHWLADQRDADRIRVRVTCAPHYQRILRQTGRAPGGGHGGGCMGGRAFAFVSHRGVVQICGFLDVECGSVREADFDFQKIWEESPVFRAVRDRDGYGGRCGRCEFRRVCGGCRARAYAAGGDYLGEEPFCVYEPKGKRVKSTDEPDELDRRIMTLIQTSLPVQRRPYHGLAEELGAEPDRVLGRVRRLRESGRIRRIGPVFDSKRLGYVSTLVAARIPPERRQQVAERVSELPAVTHNYRREHDYNLWFTLTARSERELEELVEMLRRETGLPDFHQLSAVAVYKRRVVFQLSKDVSTGKARSLEEREPVELTEQQKELVRLLQDDLPVKAEPFAEVAERLGRPLEQVLQQIRQWVEAGVVRRFGAVVSHRKVGYSANGMAVFRVPEDEVDEAGRALAEREDVTHCYRRPTAPGWPYNLFGMVHGRSQEEVRDRVKAIAEEWGLEEYDILFSTTEYKKTSMRYFTEESGVQT